MRFLKILLLIMFLWKIFQLNFPYRQVAVAICLLKYVASNRACLKLASIKNTSSKYDSSNYASSKIIYKMSLSLK